MSAIAATNNASTPWLRDAFWRGLLWLIFLGPFFFFTYGFANQHAASVNAASGVPSLVFSWESGIPLWPWSIIPYWSIDLLYGFAFLLCRDKIATDRLALRLITAQVICVACFFFWPLRFAFDRPPVEGISGMLFTLLTDFDLPYNQAPSLHIALLVVIWRQMATFVSTSGTRAFIHFWAFLIGVSVLTTWQHHFIDVPTGLAVGMFCLWLWPEQGKSPVHKAHTRRPKLALPYLLGAALLFAVALALGGAALLLCWPALSLTLVAFNYAWAGAAGFQKHDGRHSLAAQWLFAPYTLAAWFSARLHTWRQPAPTLIGNGVWVGRLPTRHEFADWAKQRGGNVALFDLAAELPAPALSDDATYFSMPCLDLAPIPAATYPEASLLEAVRRLAILKRKQPDCEIWIACALGVSRSASVAAAWLCATAEKQCSVADTFRAVQNARPQVIIGADGMARLEEFCKGLPRHGNPVTR